MVAPPIGDGAADEREDRQDQPGDFVRPEKRLSEGDARHDIGKHENELAEQRADDNRFGQPVERAQSKRRHAAPPTADSAFVFALNCAQSPFADTEPYRAAWIRRAIRAWFNSDAPPSPHGFPPHWLSFGEAVFFGH